MESTQYTECRSTLTTSNDKSAPQKQRPLLPRRHGDIVASTGDIYAGLWYPVIFASITVVIGLFFLPETKDVDIKST